jgi:hypothetical protein
MVARPLAVALVALVFLPVLAYAFPADHTWFGGLYDDDDYDDIIILVSNTPSPPPTAVVRCPDPHRTRDWLIPALEEQIPPPATPPRPLSRGPPLS